MSDATTPYYPTGRERLLLLAEHLEKGKLGHAQFNFGIFNDSHAPTCGTAGCAIGECPILFPKDWNWGKRGEPLLIDGRRYDASEDGERFFGLDEREFDHLFIPLCQVHLYGGEILDDDATAAEVAANIRAFVAIKDEEDDV